MKETELAWAAGFFEGEGCVSIVRTTFGRITLVLTQAGDPWTLGRFRNAVGGRGRVRGPYLSPGHLPAWRWRITARADVIAVMECLRPYLGPKSDKLKKFDATRTEMPEWWAAVRERTFVMERP